MNKILSFSFALFCFSLNPNQVQGDERLSSTMGEVLLRNLQPGATYHLTSLLNFPLRVSYEGERPVSLIIQPAWPEINEGKEGFEPIPSLEWVALSPSQFELESSSTIASNVSIFIPDDDLLLGKKFIVYLWSKTMGKGKGMSIGLGTKSRLLLSLAKEKNVSSAISTAAKSYMQFAIEPPAIRLKEIVPGKKTNLNKILNQHFWVKNSGDEAKEFKLEMVSGESLEMRPPEGTEWAPPDTEHEILPNKMEIGGRRSKKFRLKIKIADQPDRYGKKYHLLLRVSPKGVGISSGILFRIDLETVARKERT